MIKMKKVSYNLAVKLKEMNIRLLSNQYYINRDKSFDMLNETNKGLIDYKAQITKTEAYYMFRLNAKAQPHLIMAPVVQQVVTYLRDVHGLHIYIYAYITDKYLYEIQNIFGAVERNIPDAVRSKDYFLSYYEAVEAGIFKTLEMIENGEQ